MTGRLVATAVVVVAAAVLAWAVGAAAAHRAGDDPYSSFHLRRLAHYGAVLAGAIALIVVWRNAIGHLALFGGLFAAGIAFALQELIGAIAGWFNILSGRIYRVGDRIELAGVVGDVLEVTPLRTKILEIGQEPIGDTAGVSWVQGRQATGRIVSLSNKLTFTSPTYNFSAAFDYVWEELMVPVPHDADWRQAEEIVLEVAKRVSETEGAENAMREMERRYPVPRTEVEPHVYMRFTDNFVQLSARFVVPVRESRTVKNHMFRHIHTRLAEVGIPIASETIDVTTRPAAPSE